MMCAFFFFLKQKPSVLIFTGSWIFLQTSQSAETSARLTAQTVGCHLTFLHLLYFDCSKMGRRGCSNKGCKCLSYLDYFVQSQPPLNTHLGLMIDVHWSSIEDRTIDSIQFQSICLDKAPVFIKHSSIAKRAPIIWCHLILLHMRMADGWCKRRSSAPTITADWGGNTIASAQTTHYYFLGPSLTDVSSIRAWK